MKENTQIVPLEMGDIIQDYGALTDKQVRAAEYLAHGASIQQTARLVKVTAVTIRNWLAENAEFSTAVALANHRITSWRANEVKRLSMLAFERLEEILDQKYTEAIGDDRKEIARTARFMAELSAPNESSATQTNNLFAAQVHISDPSADIIARRIKEMELEGAGRPELSTTYAIKETPRSFVCHPDTDYGVLNYNTEELTFQCHICGKWFIDVYAHAESMHGLLKIEYKETFGIT